MCRPAFLLDKTGAIIYNDFRCESIKPKSSAADVTQKAKETTKTENQNKIGVWRSWAKRFAASGGRNRRSSEVKKQGVMRSAPSEQYDYVFEGSAADVTQQNKRNDKN